MLAVLALLFTCTRTIKYTRLMNNDDFIQLYNAATNDNADFDNTYNESIYPSDDRSNYCKYYTPEEILQTIGQQIDSCLCSR